MCVFIFVRNFYITAIKVQLFQMSSSLLIQLYVSSLSGASSINPVSALLENLRKNDHEE